MTWREEGGPRGDVEILGLLSPSPPGGDGAWRVVRASRGMSPPAGPPARARPARPLAETSIPSSSTCCAMWAFQLHSVSEMQRPRRVDIRQGREEQNEPKVPVHASDHARFGPDRWVHLLLLHLLCSSRHLVPLPANLCGTQLAEIMIFETIF